LYLESVIVLNTIMLHLYYEFQHTKMIKTRMKDVIEHLIMLIQTCSHRSKFLAEYSLIMGRAEKILGGKKLWIAPRAQNTLLFVKIELAFFYL